tara:strand:+ start:510 stop:779 length:270 start_codon:yes stop_codon:yes gene_type:complete
MVRKLKGDLFLLTANDLISGEVIFLSEQGWSKNHLEAKKIARDKIEEYEKIAKEYEKKCEIISPFFVELDETGKIKTLRDIIRINGLTF